MFLIPSYSPNGTIKYSFNSFQTATDPALSECGSNNATDSINAILYHSHNIHLFAYVAYPYNPDLIVVFLSSCSTSPLGDWFIQSNYGVHSRQFQVGVLNVFAQLWDLEKDDYWDTLQTVEPKEICMGFL